MKTNLRALLLAVLCSLAPLVSSAQDSVPVSPEQIESAVRAGDYRSAETMLARVIKVRPNNARAWYWMAQVQEKLNEPDKARRALDQAEKLQPDLKFASPNAVEAMRGRLARATAPSTQNRTPAPTSIPGYDARPAVNQGSMSAPAAAAPNINRVPSTSNVQEPKTSSAMGWLIGAVGLAALAGGGFFFYTRREKIQKAEARERERRALLARANSAFERATALTKTARFESQEASSFGARSASSVSKATSAISRLASSGAQFSSLAESEQMQDLESSIETLENQAARLAWDEKTEGTALGTAFGRAPDSISASGSNSAPLGSSGFQGSVPAGASGMSNYATPAPQTVVVEQAGGGGLLGGGFMQSMLLANVLSSANGHDHGRERELERENSRLREENSSSGSGRSRTSDASAAAGPSSFDLGSGSSSWDTGSSEPNPASSFDSGSSSSDSDSSWDSGSSSDSSSDSS